MLQIRFTLNGKPRETLIEPGEFALGLLRRLAILSVHDGCSGEGTCGVCAILLDGKLVNSCHLLAAQLDGRDVRTGESLTLGPNLDAVQQAFLEAGLVQCGYCTPAMLLATVELLAKTPRPSRAEIRDAFSGILCRCTGYEQVYEAFDLIVARAGKDPNHVFRHVEFCPDLRHVGKLRRKVDAARFLRSDPSYVEDKLRPDALVLKVLASPHAHAIITSIDVEAARKVPGVGFILTHENGPDVLFSGAGQGFPEPSPYDRRIMNRKLRFRGDRVAAVAAETEAAALEALAKIKVVYEVLPPLLSIEAARDAKGVQVHSEDDVEYCFPIGADLTRNMAASNAGGIGDCDRGFAESDVVIERTYRTGHIQCTPLEPHVCQTYMEGDRLIISASTQVPFHVRRIVAKLLAIPEERIRVIKERVGGGFGAKQDIVLEELAAFITWKTGRPVYFRFTREEEFVASRTRHPTIITIKIGAKKDGRIHAVEMNSQADTGAYGVHCLTVPMNAASKSLPLLRCPNMRFDIRVFYTNNVVAGAYQGYGAPAGSFALQTAIAELAEAVGMDYLDMIRLNHVRTGDRLEILKILGEGQEGIPQKVSSCGLDECLDRGAISLKWNRKDGPSKPWAKRGKGFAMVQQGSGLPGIDNTNAILKMIGNGSFILLSGGADLGTGLDTLCVKMAAEVLQTDFEKVAVLSGDTDATPFDKGAYASSGSFFTGYAAKKAAEDLAAKILDYASRLMKIPAAKLRIEYPGRIVSTCCDKTMTYAEIAHKALSGSGEGQLIGVGRYTTEESSIPYGAHFAEVEVDTRTGKVTVIAYHAYQDCGTPVNPELARGQLFGGVLKSIGHSLYEEMKFDAEGRCLNPNFTDYKVPTIDDLPADFRVETVFVDDPIGPFGAKSISEIATNAAAPAIATAIHDACGIWMRDFPFTPEKVLRALKEKSKP